MLRIRGMYKTGHLSVVNIYKEDAAELAEFLQLYLIKEALGERG